jgi:hypothetical protein
MLPFISPTCLYLMQKVKITMHLKTITLKLTFLPLFLCVFVVFQGCASKKNQNFNPVVAEPGWTLLFDGKTMENWEITQFGPQGPVQVSDGEIVLAMGDGCTGINWAADFPQTDYEVKLEAKKITGNDFFCGITFPAGDSYCSFIVGGWGGPVVGISSIDGLDASENETRKLKKFDHGTWYTIHLRVSNDSIKTWIDGEKFVDISTSGRKISTRSEVNLSKPFGICSWNTTAALRNIQLKKIK